MEASKVTQYYYDWQDQPVVEVDGAGTANATIYYNTYDNLGEVTPTRSMPETA